MSTPPGQPQRLPPGEIEVRAGWLLSALALTLFPIIPASLVFGLMGTTFGWLASSKRHRQGRTVLAVGAAATAVSLLLGILWSVHVKQG